MLLGENKSGKTSIVKQFLYDKFSERYKETMDDMYRGEFDIYGKTIGFDIQDVSGGYIYEFPGMRDVSITSSDAFILVFSFDSYESWEEVGKLRDMIQVDKGDDIPIVVVGNKSDLRSMADPRIPVESLEAIVTFDWENGYVECCAKDNVNINTVFKELLNQAKGRIESSSQIGKGKGYPVSMRRRTSLPQVPAFDRLIKDESTRSPSPMRKTIPDKRSTSLPFGRKDSCKLQ